MDGQKNILHLGIGIVMIAVNLFKIPPMVGVPLFAVGACFIAWGLFRRQMTVFLDRWRIGRWIVTGMDGLGALTENRDEIYFLQVEKMDQAWAGLSADERAALTKMVVTGAPECTAVTWQSLAVKALVVGTFGRMAEMRLNPEMRDFVRAKVRIEINRR